MTDSLALDAAAQASHPNAHRWDYLLGTQGRKKPIVGVEVHPVTAGEVDRVIKKKQWAVAEMDKHFQSGQRVSAWHWVASGRTRLSKTTREYRQLTQAGIILAGARVTLSDDQD